MSMVKLTLEKSTVVNGGMFFDKVVEASNRGCKLAWDNDYSKAVLQLDTTAFFSPSDAMDIVKNGGEVEYYLSKLVMNKEHYESALIPDFLQEDIEIKEEVIPEEDEVHDENVQMESEEESAIVYNVKHVKTQYTYRDYFPFVEFTDENKAIVTMSHNSELLKFSTVAKIAEEDSNVELCLD